MGLWAAPLTALLTACGLWHVVAEPCPEVSKYNVVQFTEDEGQCYYDLDDFIQDNDYVYVLFYAPKGRLNIDIGAKFEQLAEEWKYSRIHFGKIDVDKDRQMASKWVEPNMIPTNVMYKFGRPVEVKPKDFEQIRDKYHGSPEGQKWMLTKYMGEDGPGTNLHYVVPLMSAKKLTKFVEKHEIAIVGFFVKDGDKANKAFLESVWSLYHEIDRDDIGAGIASTTMQSVIKNQKAQTPSIVVYLDGKVVEEEGTFTAKKWEKKAVVEFLRQFLPLSDVDSEPPLEGDAKKQEL